MQGLRFSFLSPMARSPEAQRRYYHAKKAAGFSIPASEHSTITSWGVQKEVDAMRNMLLQYPAGLVACVSDSFDVFKACREYWGDSLKDMIKGRISGDSWGRLVVRPDSGDPSETCVQILQILCEQFKEDVTLTSTGHRLLPQYLRVIQGDGVDYASIPKIFNALKSAGFAAENMVFGSGGALLQKLNRDTFKCLDFLNLESMGSVGSMGIMGGVGHENISQREAVRQNVNEVNRGVRPQLTGRSLNRGAPSSAQKSPSQAKLARFSRTGLDQIRAPAISNQGVAALPSVHYAQQSPGQKGV